MNTRYEDAAREVEARIEVLEDRAARWASHPTMHTRVASVEAEISDLKAKDLAKWRSTGNWANEIWG